MGDTFLYAVFDSGKQTVVYIGLTGRPVQRLSDHRRRFGPTVDLFVIKRVPHYYASHWEKSVILAARRLGYPLENKNYGGGGGVYYPATHAAPFQALPLEVYQLQVAIEAKEETPLFKDLIARGAQFQASLLQK